MKAFPKKKTPGTDSFTAGTSIKLLYYSCAKQTQTITPKTERTGLRFKSLSTEGKTQLKIKTKPDCVSIQNIKHFPKDT